MSRDENHEPRWPALIGMVAAAFLYLALPEPLSLGPSWLLLAVILVLLIPIVTTYRRGRYNVARSLTFIANGVITVAMVASLFFLIQGLPLHRESPRALLRSAGALWVTNILVFALWYWKLDAGDRSPATAGAAAWKARFCFHKWPCRMARIRLGRPTLWTISSSPLTPAQHSRQLTPRSCRAGQKSA